MGDQIIATGLARGAAARGKRIAFGDGRRIIWDGNSEPIFRGNPNIAPPGSERAGDIEWQTFYKGRRGYNWHDVHANRWVWNLAWRCTPGELFFSGDELAFSRKAGAGFVVIEPHIETWKSVAPNKQWPRDRYAEVARRLQADGARVVQFSYPHAMPLAGVESIATPSFRHAAAVLANAALYVGPEGGLHHAAAAVGVKGVVIFGGFIPVEVTGYDTHVNLGADRYCGSLSPCRHCKAALDAITVDTVYEAARGML